MNETATQPPGVLVIISGPSGVGKQTIVSGLAQHWTFHFSVSATTRSRRPDEIDGVDYHFVSQPEFQEMIAAGRLLEWEEYDGQHYGTLTAEVEDPLAGGKDVVVDVEAKGAQSIMDAYPQAVSVFLMPPSMEELENRLRSRGDMTEARIASRLRIAPEQVELGQNFRYQVVNDQVDNTVQQILGIIRDNRHPRSDDDRETVVPSH